MTTTLDRLSAILVKDYKIAPEALTMNAPLEALGIDSLGMAELLFYLEDEFNITLPQEPSSLITLGDVVNYIDALTPATQDNAANNAVATIPT